MITYQVLQKIYARIFELRYLLKETPKNLSKGYKVR